MQIAKHRAVAVSYQLTLDDGFVVDATEKDSPMWYLHGAGHLLPRFEKELQGLKAGDAKAFSIGAKEGYGEYEPERVIQIPKKNLDKNYLPGDMVSLESNSGHKLHGRISSVEKDTVKIDCNHELAGKNLNFSVQVVDVRPATKEELAHGHAHAPGEEHHGHEHHHEEHVHGPGCNHG